MQPSRNRALVLGGGMAGLLAARVLSDAYAQVLVVDRDGAPDAPAPRRGVPQAGHAHALLARGRQVLEDLFPGLTDELAQRGVPIGDILGDTRLRFNGHRLRRTTAGLMVVSASRTTLEHHVRERVRRCPGVRFLPPATVLGLTTSADGAVTGARILRRADGSAEEALEADVVVDALGRGSRTPRWLEQLGHGRAQEDVVGVDLAYVTRRYRAAPDDLGGDMASLTAPYPDHPLGGVFARLEDDVWMLTLSGMVGQHPPTDAQAFEAAVGSLADPDIAATIASAQPLDEPSLYRFPASVRIRYDAAGFPAGLVPMGDSMCSFNPVYGQGMTVAALQAVALGSLLRRGQEGEPRRVLDAVTRVVEDPWEMAIGADLAFPDVSGPRSAKLAFAGAYIGLLHHAAEMDATLAAAFMRVSGLVAPPKTLMRPTLLARVVWQQVRPDRSSVDNGGHVDKAVR